MNALKLSLLSLLFLSGPVLATDSAVVLQTNAADPLVEALPILQAKYPDFKALQFKQGDHLSDLIARSNGGISLVSPKSATSDPAPIQTADLPENIIYWRLASFTPEKSWADLTAQLAQVSPTVTGIVLDLRSNSAPDDYPGAAQILTLCVPHDQTLSKFLAGGVSSSVTGNSPGHPFAAPIVVLTNHQTTGAAEALATCLKSDGALVVGRATAGKVAVFEEQKLSTGQVLRYVVAPVSLADGTPLWGRPVMPDIAMMVNDRAEQIALTLIRDNHLLDVVEEASGPQRMSEAALVRGDDPERDAYLASLEKSSDDHYKLPPIHDEVLISALDSLKAIRLSERPVPPPTQTPASLE